MSKHRIVSHDEWIAARSAFLAKEKEFTHTRDVLAQSLRDLPWEKIEKPYVFDGPNGQETLADLFAGKTQLAVYHFMFNPESDAGCKHCSFWADNFNGIDVHLRHRDTTFLACSRAPLAKLEAFKKRMGWSFKWVSSSESDFNFDFQASFRAEQKEVFFNYRKEPRSMDDREGISIFYKEDAAIFHTYSAYARGIDIMSCAYNVLDMTPKGRDEGGSPQSWVRYHDKYEE